MGHAPTSCDGNVRKRNVGKKELTVGLKIEGDSRSRPGFTKGGPSRRDWKAGRQFTLSWLAYPVDFCRRACRLLTGFPQGPSRGRYFPVALSVLMSSVCIGCAHSQSNSSQLDSASSPPPILRPINGVAVGPLRVSTRNPRYFTNDGTNVVLLAGSHTWANLQDRGTPSPAVFNYSGYIDFMKSHGLNIMHLWTWWFPNSGTAKEGPYQFTGAPYVWARTGPGYANDGGLKFDLARLDQSYFNRMRSRILQAGRNGIYVSIYLFNGYEFQFDVNANDGNPFESINNVNGVDCPGTCPTDNSQLSPRVWNYEKNYIHKVIDTVNDLDNVLYMTSNESGSPYSDTWEARVIAEIRDYEAPKPKQHPVGMSFQYKGGTDQKLYNSAADWVSPAYGGGGLKVPPNATGQCPTPTGNGGATNPSSPTCKVVINDTDHDCGICGTQAWVWQNFTRGNNVLFMDQYLINAPSATYSGYNNSPGGPCSNNQCTTVDPQWNPVRNAMEDVLVYANRKIDLVNMTPQDSLSTSGYTLANPGSQYVVYSLTNSFTLTTVVGTYFYEWFNPTTHAIAGTGSVTVRTNHKFTAPFRGESVLWLHK